MADLYTGSIGNLDSGATGMVGIGTSDPAGALEVNGNAVFDRSVGIGTNQPAYPLDLVPGSNSRFCVDQEGSRPVVRIMELPGENDPVLQFQRGSDFMNLSYDGTNLDTGGLNVGGGLIVDGNMGIGTSSPAGTLQVNGEFITNDPWFDIRAYGASATTTNGTISAGSKSLTVSDTESFKAGQFIWVTGVGTYGESYCTSILSVDSSTSLTLAFAPSQNAQGTVFHDNKRAIQNAINAAALNGQAGTVLIPNGNYFVQTAGGTPSNASKASGGSITLTDTEAKFDKLDIELNDVFINITQNWAGLITGITPTTLTIGNLTNPNAALAVQPAPDFYSIPGLVMKNGVVLTGISVPTWATNTSTITVAPTASSPEFSATGFPMVAITADPTWNEPRIAIKNLTIQRAVTGNNSIPGDICIDVCNYTSPVVATIDNICIPPCGSNYQFSTGIRVAAWDGIVENCLVNGCAIGIDLNYPDGQTNALTLFNNKVFPGGGMNDSGRIGVQISGCNNKIIGGCIGTSTNNDVTLVKIGGNYPNAQNSITGVYFDGSDNTTNTTGNVAVSFDSISSGNMITGCHLDSSFSGSLFQEAQSIQGQNTVISNGSDESNQNLPCNIAGNVGIGTTAAAAKLEVYGTSVFNGNTNLGIESPGFFSFLQESGKMLLGWNMTNGDGEADFIANRDGGSTGGFAFYDYSNEGALNQLMRIEGSGNVGIGTTNPGATLDVSGTALFKPASDSTSAFQVQSAEGAAVLDVDTTSLTYSNGLVTANNLEVSGNLLVGGSSSSAVMDVNTSGNLVTVTNLDVTGTLKVNGTQANIAGYQAASLTVTEVSGIPGVSLSTLDYVQFNELVCLAIPAMQGNGGVGQLVLTVDLSAIEPLGGTVIVPCWIGSSTGAWETQTEGFNQSIYATITSTSITFSGTTGGIPAQTFTFLTAS
jgi:hypothetical protein